MKVTNVNIYPYETKKKTNLLAFAEVTFDECFVLKGVRIMDGKKGPFVAMPSSKGSDGEYYDNAFPITKEFREELNGAILDAFDEDDEEEEAPKKKSSRRK